MNFMQKEKIYLFKIAVIMIFIGVISLFTLKTPGFAVYIGGEYQFALKHEADLEKALNKIEQEREASCSQELELATKVECKRSLVNRNNLLSFAEAQNKLKTSIEFKVPGAAIMVNGKTIAYLESKEAANKLLARIKNEYSKTEPGEKLVAISFAEKVTIKEEKISEDKLLSEDEAYSLICTGTENPEKYIVQEGDNLWLIARRNDMYVDDIVKANHLTSENLQLEQELILVKSKPYINVLTQVEGQKNEQIPYETEVIVDKNAPSSIRVKNEGQNGEKRIVFRASKINGVIEEIDIIEEKILKQAINKVIVKGTQVTRVASRGGGGSGTLDWPTYGPITQYYGGSHTGLDIGGSTGQAIRAADSGYVSFTGYQGGYGNLVIVNHNNGIITRYAHCSSIKASYGQQVEKGQTIALLGSTGRSTGPHLHFEVLVNGAFKNPLNYLR
ncbi:MAG: peptidoglycan DD-metalloendopeptidase family protein [Syntrophomonadaceae bacterium]|jgi:murein DD-endopeptidase MepM/ murein hydrolase activator NlpD